VRRSVVRRAGFSLLELMIAVAIVAILAAIAYPSYQEHLRKGRRAAAQTLLIEAANRQQQYLLDARAYALGGDALTELRLTVPPEVAAFYAVTVEPDAPTIPPTYTLRAVPIAASAQASDGEITLDQAGQKTRNGQVGW
jgi:type IV pilus assembly protein PilE